MATDEKDTAKSMYYRADKRDFSVGQTIQTAGQFQQLNPGGADVVEEIFEFNRPIGKPKRRNSLFLFTSGQSAKRHWSKMTGGLLYVVEALETSDTHRGDMILVNSAFNNVGDERAVSDLAKKYWDGFLTEKPVVEVLVADAKVVGVISKHQGEREDFLGSWAIANYRRSGSEVMKTIECSGRDGKTRIFEYTFTRDQFQDGKYTFKVFSIPRPLSNEAFEMSVSVIDENTVRVVTANHFNEFEYKARGIPDALLFAIKGELGKNVESSPGGSAESTDVYRTGAATRYWNRLCKQNRAIYDNVRDVYVLQTLA